MKAKKAEVKVVEIPLKAVLDLFASQIEALAGQLIKEKVIDEKAFRKAVLARLEEKHGKTQALLLPQHEEEERGMPLTPATREELAKYIG